MPLLQDVKKIKNYAMSQALNIQAVLFDADGVLQEPVERGREKIASLCGSGTPNEEFLMDFFKAETPCLRGEADLAVTVAEVLKKWDSPFSVEQAIETHTKIVVVNDESLDVVRAVRRSGVGAYLATNQHEYRAKYMSEVFGYAEVFDGEFYSCRLGSIKPDTDYFYSILESLPIPPERLLFIDDRERNVAAARSVGIHGAEYEIWEGVEALRNILKDYGLQLCP